MVEADILLQEGMHVEVVHRCRYFQLLKQRIGNKGRHEQAIDDFHMSARLYRVSMCLTGIDNKHVTRMNVVMVALENMDALSLHHIDELNELMAVFGDRSLHRPSDPERKFILHVSIASQYTFHPSSPCVVIGSRPDDRFLPLVCRLIESLTARILKPIVPRHPGFRQNLLYAPAERKSRFA